MTDQKTYTDEEDIRRKDIFQENAQKINVHNDKVTKGIETISDSDDEKQVGCLGAK